MNSASLTHSFAQVNGLSLRFSRIRGIAKMTDIKDFVRHIVLSYKKYDEDTKDYIVIIDDLPDFTQEEFAGILMATENGLACEATGPDNPLYDKVMLPALIKFMQNSTDKDEEIEFATIWRVGVKSYMRNRMCELLDEAVYSFNFDRNWSWTV